MPYMDPWEKFRIAQTLPHIKGRLLDVGCGYNNLVSRHGSGIGIDVHPWPGIDLLINRDDKLPFEDRSFDTVTMLAVLNHVTNRAETLSEINRILSDSGRLLVTMIGPLTGAIAHITFRNDHSARGKMSGELNGMARRDVHNILAGSGFKVTEEINFELGFNTLYVARKHNGRR